MSRIVTPTDLSIKPYNCMQMLAVLLAGRICHLHLECGSGPTFVVPRSWMAVVRFLTRPVYSILSTLTL
jgi:hypothetical protein